ncbi:uncharacterized protein LOC128270201 [Anopheles cruzii]|uniref:uncharacterized protein LOC128270201 n=1 Tax=Anopheles cruzii TaxID=68878 RepID=UPI0022EC694E|nr:uncharacterized protein LOC128270201 [Anopheles cruzii]
MMRRLLRRKCIFNGQLKKGPKNAVPPTAVVILDSEPEENPIATDWDVESYRKPFDTRSVWNLKKWFMELHKESIAEEELVPIAQAFANVQVYRCSYPDELMERLQKLGEPVTKVYRNLQTGKSTRILVPAQDAIRLEHRGVPYLEHLAELKAQKEESLLPIIPPRKLADIFQNIVVVNNSLKDTILWLERLGGGTISLAMCPLVYGVVEVKAFASYNLFLTKAAGPYNQAYAQCVANLMEIFRSYCYQVNYIRRFEVCDYYNVERLLRETDTGTEIHPNNIGFQMLRKLGWVGGPLGFKQQGIVTPIAVVTKHNRLGLGSDVRRPKKAKALNWLCANCEMDVDFYKALMETVVRKRPYYDLIFSPAFTETERIVLTRLAAQYRIRCETRQSVNGSLQFVIKRFPLPPHEVLLQVLARDHPVCQKFYEVIPPKFSLIPK